MLLLRSKLRGKDIRFDRFLAVCFEATLATYADRKRQDEEVKARISEKLVQSGEKERLKELLRLKLVESGWRDEMKLYCKGIRSWNSYATLIQETRSSFVCWYLDGDAEVIRNKGIDQVTVEDLVEEMTPKGRGKLLESVGHMAKRKDSDSVPASGSDLGCVAIASVPEGVKNELLEKIKAFIEKEA
ncbi:hypothetical protein BBJ28_00008405 [Nothophytophthora sp. Chile5]|nr:hypothetical protein BBJ28_00008405 [Nothophytophthora sp. Chile5]